MRPTTWTVGCATIAVVLSVIGLYLDSLGAIAVAIGLTALILGQVALFLLRTTRHVDTLMVEREIGRSPVYRGTPVKVRVSVPTPPTKGLKIRLTDLPPLSAVYDPGNTTLDGGVGEYQLRFMAPGDVSFRGLLVEATNRFFSTTILCASHGCTKERITVRPTEGRISELIPGRDAGMRELDRIGLPRGEGISGFRPYRHGDDLSLVDWKLTAKYGKPFVRQRTIEAGNAPLVIVDLPVAKTAGTTTVLSAAGAAIERVYRENGQCTLLLITGGEVIDFRYHESDLVTLLRLLDLPPPDQVRPLYRVLDPKNLLERLRSAERGTLISSQRLAAALQTSLRKGIRSVFEQEIDRAMALAEHREVVVYTAASEDVSHLNMIAGIARRRRRHLVIRLPRVARASHTWLSPYPRVEMI